MTTFNPNPDAIDPERPDSYIQNVKATVPSKNGNTQLLIIILFGLFFLNRKKK